MSLPWKPPAPMGGCSIGFPVMPQKGAPSNRHILHLPFLREAFQSPQSDGPTLPGGGGRRPATRRAQPAVFHSSGSAGPKPAEARWFRDRQDGVFLGAGFFLAALSLFFSCLNFSLGAFLFSVRLLDCKWAVLCLCLLCPVSSLAWFRQTIGFFCSRCDSIRFFGQVVFFCVFPPLVWA